MNFNVTFPSSSLGPTYSSSIAAQENKDKKIKLEGCSYKQAACKKKKKKPKNHVQIWEMTTYSCSRCLTNPLPIVSVRHWRWLSRRPSALRSCCTLDISIWHLCRWAAPALPVCGEGESRRRWCAFVTAQSFTTFLRLIQSVCAE